jgi:hypothetical protein
MALVYGPCAFHLSLGTIVNNMQHTTYFTPKMVDIHYNNRYIYTATSLTPREWY